QKSICSSYDGSTRKQRPIKPFLQVLFCCPQLKEECKMNKVSKAISAVLAALICLTCIPAAASAAALELTAPIKSAFDKTAASADGKTAAVMSSLYNALGIYQEQDRNW